MYRVVGQDDEEENSMGSNISCRKESIISRQCLCSFKPFFGGGETRYDPSGYGALLGLTRHYLVDLLKMLTRSARRKYLSSDLAFRSVSMWSTLCKYLDLLFVDVSRNL